MFGGMSMGFFDKIKRGLTKTKQSLIKNIESVVIGYAQIDEDFLEDLEWYSFPVISVSVPRII